MVESKLDMEGEDEKQGVLAYNDLSTTFKIIEQVPIDQENVHFRIDCDFDTDKAYFYYSLNGKEWQHIGKPLQMIYTFTKHFMGYRFGLFNYATQEAGGYVDFDYYRIDKVPMRKKP